MATVEISVAISTVVKTALTETKTLSILDPVKINTSPRYLRFETKKSKYYQRKISSKSTLNKGLCDSGCQKQEYKTAAAGYFSVIIYYWIVCQVSTEHH